MLALGADFVLLGRAWGGHALGARGGEGVAHVLKLIEAEIRVAMALTGCTRIADILIPRSSTGANGAKEVGRGERIRTSGPCLPKTVLYQAELLPDRNPLAATKGRGGSQGRG